MPHKFDRIRYERDEYYYDRNTFADIRIPIAKMSQGDFVAGTDDLFHWFQLDSQALPALPQFMIRPRLRKTWRRDINARVSEYDVNGEVAVCKPIQWIPQATIIRSFPASYYEKDTYATTIHTERVYRKVTNHVEHNGLKLESKSTSQSDVTLKYYSSEVEKVVVKERHGTRGRVVELALALTLEVEEVFTHRLHVLLGGKTWNDYLTWHGGPGWNELLIAPRAFGRVKDSCFKHVAIHDDYDTPFWIQALPVIDSAKNVVALELAFSCNGWTNWYAYLTGRQCKSTGREVLAWRSWIPRVTHVATQGNLVWEAKAFESSEVVTTSKSDERVTREEVDGYGSSVAKIHDSDVRTTTEEQTSVSVSEQTNGYKNTTIIEASDDTVVVKQPLVTGSTTTVKDQSEGSSIVVTQQTDESWANIAEVDTTVTIEQPRGLETTTTISEQADVKVSVTQETDEVRSTTKQTESTVSTNQPKISPSTQISDYSDTTVDVYDSRSRGKQSIDQESQEVVTSSVVRDTYNEDAYTRGTYIQQPQVLQPVIQPQPVAPMISSEYAFALAPVVQQMYLPQQPQYFQPQYVQPQVFQPQTFQPQIMSPYAKIPQTQVTANQITNRPVPRITSGYSDESSYSRGRRNDEYTSSVVEQQKRPNPKPSWPWLFSGWARTNRDPTDTEILRFPFTSYPSVDPKVTVGLSALEISHERNIRAYAAERHNREHLEVHLGTWSDTKLYHITAEVMTFPGNDDEIQVGWYDTLFDKRWNHRHTNRSTRINFDKAFGAAPYVLAFLNKIDFNHTLDQRCRVAVTNVDRTGFHVSPDTYSACEMYNYAVFYVAFPAGKRGICGEHNTVQVKPNHESYASGWVRFPAGKFSGTPWVMLALSGVNFGRGRKVAAALEVTETTREGFGWKMWGFDRSDFRGAHFSWVAQEGLQ